jgi:hypothetical protein
MNSEKTVPKITSRRFRSSALVLKPGRYIVIGGAVYAVMMIGGVLFFINDVIAKGPIEAGKEWGLMGVLTETIAMRAGAAIAGVVGMVIFMPATRPARRANCRGGRDRLDHLPGVPRCRHRREAPVRRRLHGRQPGDRGLPALHAVVSQVSALTANAWEIEDDDAVRRRRRKEVLAEEHRSEEDHDLAERVRFVKRTPSPAPRGAAPAATTGRRE